MSAGSISGAARAAAFASILLLGSALSGCGGGSATAPVPAAPVTNAASGLQAETVIDAGTTDASDRTAAAGAKVVYKHVRAPGGVGLSTQSVDEPGGKLTFHGGATVASALSHDVYVNCAHPASCWGEPAEFLANLGLSTFIHVTDQYIGSFSNMRYLVGAAASMHYANPAGTLYDADMLQIVHHVAKSKGTGYGHMYHVFLPQGTDECFFAGGPCYSPDNPSTFVFCAYHSSVDFGDIGHVLYSVEPYQEVPGCGDDIHSAPPHTLTESTGTVLSHETFETITDPDGTAWFNSQGFEIGDLCFRQRGNVNLHGDTYLIQPEFSDAANPPNGDCVF
jgi:hypothetical protein